MKIRLGHDDRILVMGGSKSGKTYLCQRMVGQYRRGIVFDPSKNWTPPGKAWVVVHSSDPKEFLRVTGQAMRDGNLCYVMEDVDVVMDRYELWRDPVARELFISSRHHSVAWVVVCRRAADIPVLVEKQANRVFIFWTDNRHDLKYIEDTFGMDAAQMVRDLDFNRHQFLYIDRENRTKRVAVA